MALVSLLIAGCSPRTDPSDQAPDQAEAAATAETAPTSRVPADPPSTAALPEADPAILAELRALVPRQNCNRVTGCSGIAGLMRHGEALIPVARVALLGGKRPDGYWSIALIEALGQLEVPTATSVLLPLLDENRWEIQLAAARGLAYLGERLDRPALDHIAAAITRERAADTPASRAVTANLEWANLRSGQDPRPHAELRQSIQALIPSASDAPGTPHPQLDAFVRLVGEARIPEALPTVRLALHSGNRFVTATALDVSGALQDTGAIGYILPLLDDPNPTLRRESLRALQRITGARQLEDAAAWHHWAKTHQIAPVPLPARLIPGPQVIVHPDELDGLAIEPR